MRKPTYFIGGSHAAHLLSLFGDKDFDHHWDPLEDLPEEAELYAVGVGDPKLRRKMWRKYSEATLPSRWAGVRDDLYAVWRPNTASYGLQAMPGVIISPSVKLGSNILLNTGCQVDHDCVIGAHCHIGPGAILCGNVSLGECCAIGAGAIIVQGVYLPDETYIPAGSLVVEHGDVRQPQRVAMGD